MLILSTIIVFVSILEHTDKYPFFFGDLPPLKSIKISKNGNIHQIKKEVIFHKKKL
jgi:hypothetical protein